MFRTVLIIIALIVYPLMWMAGAGGVQGLVIMNIVLLGAWGILGGIRNAESASSPKGWWSAEAMAPILGVAVVFQIIISMVTASMLSYSSQYVEPTGTGLFRGSKLEETPMYKAWPKSWPTPHRAKGRVFLLTTAISIPSCLLIAYAASFVAVRSRFPEKHRSNRTEQGGGG